MGSRPALKITKKDALDWQSHVITFTSDLQQVGGFYPGPQVSSTNKTDSHDITEILLKVALNSNKQTNILYMLFQMIMQ